MNQRFNGQAYVETLPEKPGVYRMYDHQDKLLYVGKAKRLKRRVGHYFLRPQTDPRLKSLISQVDHMEFTVVRTEAEALILEAQLIKTQKPRYNIQLRDNKGYPYIYLSTHQEYPKISYYRGLLPKQGKIFGPFPSGSAVRSSLSHLQKVFKLRTCDDPFFKNRSRPCLQHQIGRCSAPCVQMISKENYQKDVQRAVLFLEGKSDEVIQDLIALMQKESAAQRFEEAARIRDQIKDLRAIQAEQYVQTQKHLNIDIWVCAINADIGAITQMSFKEGIAQGSRTYFQEISKMLSNIDDDDESDEAHHDGYDKNNVLMKVTSESLLTSYLTLYYLDHLLPEEVWLDLPVSHQKNLEEALQSINKGHSFQLKNIQNQSFSEEQKRWIKWAQQNRDEALLAKIKNRQTFEDRYTALEEKLNLKHGFVQRIECIDISHTQGEKPVASSVVFGRDGAIKKFYRQFNIRDIEPGDDYAAIHQTVLRRLMQSEKEEEAWLLPQVWLIDGGLGQLKSALLGWDAWIQMQNLKPSRPIFIAVGKGVERKAGLETLWILHPNEKIETINPWQPGIHSPVLQIIQQVRDESHRFAGKHHQAKRDKARSSSALEDIPGIGPNRRKLLLNSFGGFQALSVAGIEELAKVKGISLELATKVYETLHPKSIQNQEEDTQNDI